MNMRAVSLAALGISLFASPAFAGPCPPTISVDEKPPGSAAGAIPVEHKFRYVSFFEGDPKDQADLAPDDGPNPKKLEQRWDLTRMPGQTITMVCRYHGTDKTITQVLPPAISSCTLKGEMDGHGEIIGSPVFECK